MSMSMNVYAATAAELRRQKQEAEKAKQEAQKQLDDANSAIEELTSVHKGITEEIEALDNQLVEILASISMIEDDIKEKQNQIEVAKVDLENAKQVEQNQYDSMKARIKYMYEKGDMQYVQLLLESKSTAGMVNKADYVDDLYEYDRRKLAEYVAAKEAVEEAKAVLEEEEAELETCKFELEEEEGELNTMLDEKKAQEEDFENQIAKAKQEAAAYKAKIKQQNSQIKKLETEAQKKEAEEAERKKKEEEQKKKSDPESGNMPSADNPEESPSTPSEPAPPVSTNGSAKGQEIANYACQFVGNPYVAGGTSLTNGADCSGFTMSVYKAFGYSIPRSSTAQRSAGVGVTYAEAQPGDIICYAGHVAIYLGGGRIVHASTPSSGIKYGNATYKEILTVRRIVN